MVTIERQRQYNQCHAPCARCKLTNGSMYRKPKEDIDELLAVELGTGTGVEEQRPACQARGKAVGRRVVEAGESKLTALALTICNLGTRSCEGQWGADLVGDGGGTMKGGGWRGRA